MACGLAALPPCLHACPRWRWRRLGLPPTGCAQVRWIPGAVAAVVADVSQLARPLLRGALPWDRQMRIVCRRAARAQISGARGLHGQRVEQGRAEWRSLRVQFGLSTPALREQGRPERLAATVRSAGSRAKMCVDAPPLRSKVQEEECLSKKNTECSAPERAWDMAAPAAGAPITIFWSQFRVFLGGGRLPMNKTRGEIVRQRRRRGRRPSRGRRIERAGWRPAH